MTKRVDVVLLLLAIALTICAFALFRLLLAGQMPDYAKEIAAAVFGGLLTIVITAVMLQKQSEVDMRKDRNATMLSAKLTLYGELMGQLSEILSADDITKQIVAVQVLNQRLAVLGSKDVVKAFNSFATRFAEAAKDGKLNATEKDGLLEALGDMSVQMKRDILSGEELAESDKDRGHFREFVRSNVESLKTKTITQEGFLAGCDATERAYFEEMVKFLEDENMVFEMGTKGMSVKSDEGKSVLWAFPTTARRNIELLRDGLPAANADKALELLAANGVGRERLEKKRVTFRAAELPIEELKRLLRLVTNGAEVLEE